MELNRQFDDETISRIVVRAYELLPEIIRKHQGNPLARITVDGPMGHANWTVEPQFLDGSVSAFAITGFLFHAALQATGEIVGPYRHGELVQIHSRLARAQADAY